jgi:hypothetical protein
LGLAGGSKGGGAKLKKKKMEEEEKGSGVARLKEKLGFSTFHFSLFQFCVFTVLIHISIKTVV